MISTKAYTNQHVEFLLRDEVLHFRYKHETHLTLDMAKEIVEERLRVFDEVTYPMCVDVSNLVKADDDALTYLATSDAVKNVGAIAFVIGGELSKFFVTMYIVVKRPPVVAKFFTTERSALEWIEFYKYQAHN